MAVYRVERTRDYTVMSNHHLKDTALSLKAKGLLSMFLSFPDDWNYSTRGLAAICKEGVEAIGNTIKELEKAGYIVRRKLRGSSPRSRPRRMRTSRIRPHRVRPSQIRETRIWWTRMRLARIWTPRIRKTPPN